jgi:hypothetical protein
MFVRSGSRANTLVGTARNALRFHQLLLAVVLSGVSGSMAGAQAASQRHIPIKKEARHIDTVWIHDTVTMTRVDTVFLGAAATDPVSTFRIDTIVRVDTTKNCRDFLFPVPIPIPYTHGHESHDSPQASVSVTPEPATVVLVGLGLVSVGVIARRKRAAKKPEP